MRKFICLFWLCCIVASTFAQITKSEYKYFLLGGKYERKMGFVDSNDNWIVQPLYDYTRWDEDWKLGTFSNEGSESKGLLNQWGKIIFPIGNYKSYYLITEHNFIELTDMQGKEGLSTLKGSVFVPCKYTNIYVGKNYIEVTDGKGNKGLLTLEGKEWVPCKYGDFYLSDNYIKITDKKGMKGLP